MRNLLLNKVFYINLFLFVGNYSYCQWTGSTTNPTKVCTAAGSQQSPFSVPDGAGGAIIAWQDQRSGTNDIYIDDLSSNGTLLWSVANSYSGKAVCIAANSQYINDMITDAAGNVFIVWEDPRLSNTNEDVYIQKFNSAGVAQWTANGLAVVTAANDQYNARLTSDGAGGVFVVWADFRNDATNGDSPQTFAQRLNTSGAAQWAANGIPVYGSSILSYPADVITDGSGGIIVSMSDVRNSTVDAKGNYSNIDIYAQRLNSNGAPLWGSNGAAVCTQPNNQINTNFTTVTDGSGGAIFFWFDYRNDPGNGNGTSTNTDIFAQRLNGAGSTLWTANGVAVSNSPDDSYLFKVITDGSGGAIAGWLDETTTNATLKTQRINSSGLNLWAANGTTISSLVSSSADFSLDNVGGVIYAWSGDNSITNASQILAQRINLSSGAFTWQSGGVVATSNSFGTYFPKVTTNPAGEAIVIWEDSRNSATSSEDLYATKLNNNGTLPLLWGTVTATLKGNDGIISWQTMQENNTAKFEVQRSNDATTFTTISTIAAAGNSVRTKTYEMLDKDLLKFPGKTFYYRIQQFDQDGNTSLSKKVKLAIPKNASYFKLLNNPVAKEARLSYFSTETSSALVKIIANNGMLLYSKEQTIVKGANEFDINVAQLPAGNYYIEIVRGSFRQSIQMHK